MYMNKICIKMLHDLLMTSFHFLGVLLSRSGRAGGRADWRAGGRSGGRLPDLRNPYLCNRLMDFLRSKCYGIV